MDDTNIDVKDKCRTEGYSNARNLLQDGPSTTRGGQSPECIGPETGF